MADNDEVTSPDQHKPGSLKAARTGGIFTILALLAMTFGLNHVTDLEKAWLLGLAGLIAVILFGDWVLRKNGLRS